MAGVSRTTVSVVINNQPGMNISEATRDRVLKAAKVLHYSPDAAGRKLVSGKSDTLGLVLCQSPEQAHADAFLARVIFGVEQAAMQMGFHVLINQIEPDDHSGYTHLISENLVDGLIVSGPRQDDKGIVELHQDGVPVMLLGQMPGTEIPFVDVDATGSAERAVQHLIELGHSDIALITNAKLSYTSAQQRRKGYLSAIEKAGIPVKTDLMKEGNYTPDSGYRAMSDLLKATPRPTAVFIASDVVALGAILAVKEAGLNIPEDISIVGFDDIPLAEFFDPPLTTVRLPAFDLGWMAGERLGRLVKKEPIEQVGLLLKTELVIRESTTQVASFERR
jgi:DNA-binding LacI/PurR family transcriptional regulator